MASTYTKIVLVGFLDFLSVFFIFPYLDIHARELGFSYIQIGFLKAIYPGCQLISSPIVGSLGDLRGRKSILLLCLIICSLAYFSLGITTSLLVYVGIRVVLGTFKHTITLTKALAPDFLDDPNDLTDLYGKLTSLGGLGIAMGPALSGFVMEAVPEYGFTIMCTALAAFCLLNAGLINSLPEITKEKKDKPGDLKATKLFDPIVNTFNQTVDTFKSIDWTKYWDIFFFKLLISISVGLYYNNFHIFLNIEHEVSPKVLGYISTFQGIVASITNAKVTSFDKYYVNDKDYTQRIFHIFLVMVVSFIGLASVPSIPFYIVLVMPSVICFTFARLVTLVIVSNRSVSNRGTLIGAFNSVSSLAGIVSPVLGGFIHHYLGVTYVFYTGAMICSLGLVLSYRARLKSLQEKTK